MTGDEFKQARKSLGLTQAALAAELDVSRPTLISWEQRASNWIPKLVRLAIIALIHVPGHARSFAGTPGQTIEATTTREGDR